MTIASLPFRTSTLLIALAPAVAAAQSVSYQRDVAPLLAARCSTCHGAPAFAGDIKNPPGGLDTTSYAALERGGAARAWVVAGSPSQSRILRSATASQKSLCDAYLARAGRRVSVVGTPASPEEMAACREAEHPSFDRTDAAIVSDWIAHGARFDAEPLPATNCLTFDGVQSERRNLLSVEVRPLSPGLATASAVDPAAGRTAATISRYFRRRDYPMAGRSSGLLFNVDTLPRVVDVRVCFQNPSEQYGSAAAIGLSGSDDLETASIDPPSSAAGEWDQISITKWLGEAGNAELQIVSASSGRAIYQRRGIALRRGLNRVVWNKLGADGGHAPDGDYAAYLAVHLANRHQLYGFLFRLTAR